MTKPQKIEGGMETKIYDILYDHSTLDEGSFGVRVSYEQDWPIKELKTLLSTEIEKAKASERQRCVEAFPKPMDYIENTPYSDSSVSSKAMYNQRKDAWNECLHQAKHNLEQMK